MIVADVKVRSAKSVKAVVPDVVGVTFVRVPPPAEYVPDALKVFSAIKKSVEF